DVVERVRALTGGEGVPVVYDSIGRATFEDSLRCLRRRGILASFGEASGDPDPVPPRRLGPLGSLYLTPPRPGDLTAHPEALLETVNDHVQHGDERQGPHQHRNDLSVHRGAARACRSRGAPNYGLDRSHGVTITSEQCWQTRSWEELKA